MRQRKSSSERVRERKERENEIVWQKTDRKIRKEKVIKKKLYQ